MPMIEGFGDEVTYGMMVLFAIFIITACWLSTQLRYIPFVNVFILESMQDLVDPNAARRDTAVPVEQETPADTSAPRDDALQVPEGTDNDTEGVTSQAETLKQESDSLLTEDRRHQESEEKSTPETSSETATQNVNASSSEDQDSAEPSLEAGSSSSMAENVAFLEAQNIVRKVNIKLIYMNNTHKIVQTRLTDTVGDFRRLHFEKELSENKTIRFIFHGKSLGNDQCTLESCNVKQNSAVHCLVTPSLVARNSEERTPSSTVHSTDLNVRNRQELSFELVLYPSIFIVFAVLWYLQFTYEQAMLYPYLMSILGVSFFLLVMSLAVYRTMRLWAVQQTL